MLRPWTKIGSHGIFRNRRLIKTYNRTRTIINPNGARGACTFIKHPFLHEKIVLEDSYFLNFKKMGFSQSFLVIEGPAPLGLKDLPINRACKLGCCLPKCIKYFSALNLNQTLAIYLKLPIHLPPTHNTQKLFFGIIIQRNYV